MLGKRAFQGSRAAILRGMARPRLRRRDRQATPTGPDAGSAPDASPAQDTPRGTTLTDEADSPTDPSAGSTGGSTDDPSAGSTAADDVPPPPPAVPRRRFLDATPLLLVRAAHPRQAVATALLLSVAAALADRPTRDLGLVLVTVLVGQALLGWHNDLVDRRRDARHGRTDKPVADGRLDPGTAWFAVACAVLLVIPLSLSNGITAGLLYLVSVAIGVLGNYTLRTGLLSWVPWAAAFALYPAFLSFGGWGNHGGGSAPQPAMTVLAVLLGIGVHLLTALWGLVADHEDGWTYLPLRLGMRIGAARLLALTTTYLALVAAGMIITGTLVGLHA